MPLSRVTRCNNNFSSYIRFGNRELGRQRIYVVQFWNFCKKIYEYNLHILAVIYKWMFQSIDNDLTSI